MNSLKISSLMILLLFIVSTGCEKKEKEAIKELEKPAKITTTEKPKLDWLALEEDTFIPLLTEMGDHLQAAKQAFLEKKYKIAANHLRDGAAYLKQDITYANRAGKVLSEEAITDLDNLANDMEQKKIVSEKQLKDVFKRAYLADVQEHYIIAQEDYWIPLIEAPEEYFQNARDNIANKDMKAAAMELRKGTALLKVEASRAKGEAKTALQASVNELNKLAEDMENGITVTEKTYSDTIARAYQVLALHHREMAAESWANKEAKKAGQELKAAAYHFEQASKWAGHEMKAETETVLKNSKAIAQKLITEVDYAGNEVKKGIADLGNEIDKLDQKLRPNK